MPTMQVFVRLAPELRGLTCGKRRHRPVARARPRRQGSPASRHPHPRPRSLRELQPEPGRRPAGPERRGGGHGRRLRQHLEDAGRLPQRQEQLRGPLLPQRGERYACPPARGPGRGGAGMGSSCLLRACGARPGTTWRLAGTCGHSGHSEPGVGRKAQGAGGALAASAHPGGGGAWEFGVEGRGVNPRSPPWMPHAPADALRPPSTEKYAQHWCSRLTDPQGPFARCHAAVNPGTYFSVRPLTFLSPLAARTPPGGPEGHATGSRPAGVPSSSRHSPRSRVCLLPSALPQARQFDTR